jgi:hypothetical protein
MDCMDRESFMVRSGWRKWAPGNRRHWWKDETEHLDAAETLKRVSGSSLVYPSAYMVDQIGRVLQRIPTK